MPHQLKSAIRVVEFSLEECPKGPSSGPPLFTFEQFHGLRNEVLSILSRYGTFGPNGRLRINESVELDTEVWHGDAARYPDFYVVSDIWNFWSRWIRIESQLRLIKPPLLEELTMTLSPIPGWCFYLALGKGGLTVFSNRILYEGQVFIDCSSIADVYQRCSSNES
jgi:hypothetical protein